jgi:hypothetical protein
MSVFKDENSMVEFVLNNSDFLELLGYNDWMKWSIRELKGYFGRPDLLVGFGKRDKANRPKIYTCAFEMKISNWKRGLVQAYRYKAFSNYSYLVLDNKYSNQALININSFVNSNIGLICIEATGRCLIQFKPHISSPYSPALRAKLVKNIKSELFEATL